ncbi:hypothetical protein Rhal01_01074 [Rubritalea halochordaticola]|uniref:DUF2132 domain-containing protein n=1 Tax=Rubritalea halochordaticola TaxID=714537 RepID=A0ABP9UWR7_9BACT
MSEPRKQANNPLHGITLERMLTELVEAYGWDDLSFRIRINCFAKDPSVKSSLKFLRRTGWARKKVEELYLYYLEFDKKEEE